MVSVTDYLTSADQALYAAGALFDATYAFDAAQNASLDVAIPSGLFGLTGFRPNSGLWLRGVGPRSTVLKQLDPELPAIDVRSDAVKDQLLDLQISGFRVEGADEYADAATFGTFVAGGGSPIAAVYFYATDTWAITNGCFDYYAKNTYSAVAMEGLSAGNIYNNRFAIVGEGHRGTAAKTGGSYNDYDLFLTQCDGFCIEDMGDDSDIKVVGENVMKFAGQRNTIRPRMEGIVVAAAAADAGIIDVNHNNTYIDPTVNLFQPDAGKLAFAFRGFIGSVWINPQIVGLGAISPLHPFGDTFGPITVIGGRGHAARIEDYHIDPAGNPQRSFQRFTLVGQNDGLSNRAAPTAHKVFTPSANVVEDYDPAWASIEVHASLDPLPYFQLNMVGFPPAPGRKLILATSKAITTIAYAGGSWGDVTALPTTLPAGGTINAIYMAAANKWLML